jgi:hypothetical protein
MSGDTSSVPPRRLDASPMLETVTSSCSPGRAKGGSWAVIMTAATFFGFTSARFCCTLMPKCCSMAAILLIVNGDEL